MKKLLPFIFVLSACATYKATPIPAFEKQVDCSETSLKYLATVMEGPKTMTPDDVVMVNEYMSKVQFVVRGCYDEEIVRSKAAPSFNLCFVTGSNKESKRDFSEFSSQRQTMSDQFWDCLKQVETAIPYPTLKNIQVVQSFKLYPDS